MKKTLLFCFVIAIFTSYGWAETPSALWGKSGERWTPQSRLPDVSHAGYHRGEFDIPSPPVAANVRDFGAVGDGEHDDTEALLRAIGSVKSGAVLIPEGKYKITQIIEITKPGIVLRGEGSDKTILYFPTVLNDIRPDWGATTTGDRTSNYSWAGGFIWFKGSFQSQTLAEIVSPAARGDKEVAVSNSASLHAGDEVEVYMSDDAENSLADHLYSGDPGKMDNLRGRTHASLVTRVVRVDGKRVVIDRPLRFDIQPRWKPVIRRFSPTVSECGIESLGFLFPVTPYQGHFTELGYNPVAMSNVAHCWARGIHIQNADSGFFIGGRFCTVDRVVYDSERPPDSTGCTGHHGVYISSDDNLFTRFQFNTRFIHDLTVSHCAGNVFSNGSGVDLCFDHHERVPYENCFTNIDIGRGTRMWKCGGGAALGRHCAARGTFWNIRADRPQSWPDGFGPDSMNLVAVQTRSSSVMDEGGRWFEAIPPDEIVPANIHEDQLRHRLESVKQTRVEDAASRQ